MRGEGLSMDCSQSRPCSGKKTLRACKMKDKIDNVVVIDIDSDGYDDVSSFDVPKKPKKVNDIPRPFQKKRRPSHVLREGNRVSFEGAISIDDDDDDRDDEDDNNLNFRSRKVDPSGVRGNRNKNVRVDGMPSSSTFGNTHKFTVDADDDCEFIWCRRSTDYRPKHNKPHTDESTSRNRFGYYSDSESGSSESDSSDCEILDGSHGNPWEQWEKASKRQKSNISKDQSGAQDTEACYNYSTDTRQNVDLGNSSRQTSLDEDQESGREHTSACSTPAIPAPVQDNQKFQDKDSSSCEDGVPGNVDNLGKSSVHKSQESPHNAACSNGIASKGVEELAPVENYAQSSDEISEKSGHQDMEMPHAEKVPRRDQLHTTENRPETSGIEEVEKPFTEPVSEFQQCGETNQLFASPVDAFLSQGNIINDREKLKETEEYKRATEEEWEARHQQLRIQAEEAHRLRKRKKAEALRISDMERRQKERLEEMRKTQKKDEENLNMKERLRVQMRKDLSLLESRCFDLASVLRGLGIDVGSGFFPPTSREVHAAYKRALLKFHPDRASRTDIRQQVEAEEKFKLISRMKEKFLPASLC
ncbi:unnamed protein product [Linum trigynum]|uniref:J domain-containing protein n=1 Tax=Linum trigynum TaxID=586398 RepID=A0AAV2ELU0_9ROSI